MLRFDAVTFMSYLDNLRATEGVKSVWLFHSGAYVLFLSKGVWAAKVVVAVVGLLMTGGSRILWCCPSLPV